MRYYLDTEFIEDGRTIDLISIGLITEDGRALYKQNTECRFELANEWVWRNVFPALAHFSMRGSRACQCENDDCPWVDRAQIRQAVLAFCDPAKYGKPQFWGYYADYDWVVFCQLFGKMVDLPKGWPMYCRDLKQLADSMGGVTLPKQDLGEHNALNDAIWIRTQVEALLGRRLEVP